MQKRDVSRMVGEQDGRNRRLPGGLHSSDRVVPVQVRDIGNDPQPERIGYTAVSPGSEELLVVFATTGVSPSSSRILVPPISPVRRDRSGACPLVSPVLACMADSSFGANAPCWL